MQSLTIQNPQLEQDLIALHTGNKQAKEWFKQSVMKILEAPTVSAYSKADTLSELFESLDLKLNYIKEQQRLLAALKKQIETAKGYAKEEVSNILLSLGVNKLDGLKISSITASKPTDKSVAKLEILNEDALIQAGFFRIELDTVAVEKALLSADQRHEVEQYADMKIELVSKPATIRINKRKSSSLNDEIEHIAA